MPLGMVCGLRGSACVWGLWTMSGLLVASINVSWVPILMNADAMLARVLVRVPCI